MNDSRFWCEVLIQSENYRGSSLNCPDIQSLLACRVRLSDAPIDHYYKKLTELLQQQPRALPASGERREECERGDDTHPTNAVGEEGWDGGNEQLPRRRVRNLSPQGSNQLSNYICLCSA